MCINMYIVVFTDSVIVHLGYEFYTEFSLLCAPATIKFALLCSCWFVI